MALSETGINAICQSVQTVAGILRLHGRRLFYSAQFLVENFRQTALLLVKLADQALSFIRNGFIDSLELLANISAEFIGSGADSCCSDGALRVEFFDQRVTAHHYRLFDVLESLVQVLAEMAGIIANAGRQLFRFGGKSMDQFVAANGDGFLHGIQAIAQCARNGFRIAREPGGSLLGVCFQPISQRSAMHDDRLVDRTEVVLDLSCEIIRVRHDSVSKNVAVPQQGSFEQLKMIAQLLGDGVATGRQCLRHFLAVMQDQVLEIGETIG